jgi:cell division protein FtsW
MLAFARNSKKPDYLILVCFILLLVFGFIALASASSHIGNVDFNDSYYYLKHQLIFGFLPGLVLFFLTLNLNYQFYKSRIFSVLFLLISIILAAMVFSPLGIRAQGAVRWLAIGPISFQPAEIFKLSLIIYLASWLSKNEKRQKNLQSGLAPFLVILGLVSGILLMQKSTSPVAVLILVALIMYFMSGAKNRYIFGIFGLAAVTLTMVIMFSDYRANRILSFLRPEADPQGGGYHLQQAKTAIGAGGLTGVGYGQATVKFRLPEPAGDSVFAVIAEEFGFIGSVVIIGLFAFLVLRIFLLSQKIKDRFGVLLLIGFGSIIGIQAVFNIGSMTGVLPLTGMPLPFISYGGTQMVIFMAMIGIILNISRSVRV